MDFFLLRVGVQLWKLVFQFDEIIIVFDYKSVQLVVRQLFGGFDDLEELFIKYIFCDMFEECFVEKKCYVNGVGSFEFYVDVGKFYFQINVYFNGIGSF